VLIREIRSHASGTTVVRVSGRATSRVRLVGARSGGIDSHTVLLDGDVAVTALQDGPR